MYDDLTIFITSGDQGLSENHVESTDECFPSFLHRLFSMKATYSTQYRSQIRVVPVRLPVSRQIPFKDSTSDPQSSNRHEHQSMDNRV